MLNVKTKIIISTILIIISGSLITFFFLLNYGTININFKFFDFENHKKFNVDTIIYILESCLIFMMFSAFSLITVPLFLFKRDLIFVSLIICVLITFGILIPEVIDIFKNVKGFWDFIVGILTIITLFILFGANIVMPIWAIFKRVDENTDVDDKKLLKFVLFAFIFVFLLNFVINIIFLLLTILAEFLGFIVGIILFSLLLCHIDFFIPRIIIF